MNLIVPEILKIPPKLIPLLTEFNNYDYFLIEGGRGSAKSQTVGRILCYIAEKRKVRTVCGREIQANIEESVYTLLKDLITDNQLAFDVYAQSIEHKTSESTFGFKGFREQGRISIKGLEGVDILWIDEAQSITKLTLDTIIPTIRKQKSKVIFSMNRHMRDDAVFQEFAGRADCLHIKINYHENPYCPLKLKNEAEVMRLKSERDYRHIWLGEPLSSADDYLFNHEKLHESLDNFPVGEKFGRQRVLGIDFAAQGNDQCVATVLDRESNQHWKLTERIVWDEPDTMISVGKIVNIIGQAAPDITVLDIGGMGKVVYDRLTEVGMEIIAFDGGSTEGVETNHYANTRAQAYYTLRDWFDNGFLCIDRKDMEVIKQLEKIKFKYRSNGVRLIQAKVDMKKEMKYSPDDADSLMMAVWGAVNHLGRSSNALSSGGNITRKSGSSRHTR